MADTAKLYMRLTGPGDVPIKGECEIAGHEGEIEVDDWRWNLNTSKTNGDPEPSTFAFGKLMDSATPKMLASLAKLGGGTSDALTAVVQLADHGERGIGGKPLFELTMTLERVIVIEYTMRLQPEEAGGNIEEDWVFDYERVRIDYRSTLHPGTATVMLLRPPGSSTESPSRRRKQIVSLAESLGGDDTEALWGYIRDGLDQGRFPSSLVETLKRIEGGKG
jgi:type VI protein secretion system component Hcp